VPPPRLQMQHGSSRAHSLPRRNWRAGTDATPDVPCRAVPCPCVSQGCTRGQQDVALSRCLFHHHPYAAAFGGSSRGLADRPQVGPNLDPQKRPRTLLRVSAKPAAAAAHASHVCPGAAPPPRPSA